MRLLAGLVKLRAHPGHCWVPAGRASAPRNGTDFVQGAAESHESHSAFLATLGGLSLISSLFRPRHLLLDSVLVGLTASVASPFSLSVEHVLIPITLVCKPPTGSRFPH